MPKIDSKDFENEPENISKVVNHILTPLLPLAYFATGISIWMITIEASGYYFREVFQNILDYKYIWVMFFEIWLYYSLSSLILFWTAFLIALSIFKNSKIQSRTKYICRGGRIFSYNSAAEWLYSIFFTIMIFVLIFLIIFKLTIFADIGVGFNMYHIIIAISIVSIAIFLALRTHGNNKLYTLMYILSHKKYLYTPIAVSLIISATVGISVPVSDYKKGYGLSCDSLYSVRNYSNNGEEYIFSNKQNIGHITPYMLEYKESSKLERWEQKKYESFKKDHNIDNELLSYPVDKNNPVSIKFLKLKDEGENIRVLITDVRKVREPYSNEPKISDPNLLNEPVVVTIPKKDLSGLGDNGNDVDKLCKKGGYK